MLLTNTESVPGKEVTEIIGIVRGSTVRAKHIGKDIIASFRNVVGGELREYTDMLEDARKIALGQMEEQAKSLGADGVINIRFMTSTISQMAAEIMVYGTAVKLK